MSDKRKVEWFDHEPGDLLGGTAFGLRVSCEIALDVHNATLTSVIPGQFCVEAGFIFVPGPTVGELDAEKPAAQVDC